MGRILRGLFGVSLIALALAVLLAIPSDTPASGIARLLVPVLAIVTVALYLLRRRSDAAVGAGLLRPGSAAGLSKAEHSSMALGVINALMDAKAAPGAIKAPNTSSGRKSAA